MTREQEIYKVTLVGSVGNLPLCEAHDRATAIEHRLKDRFGKSTHVSLHMEPIKN